jgi:predicted LPLAT superfamily acyltransferase
MSGAPGARPAQWKQRPEGGGLFAIWLIRGIGRHGGRAVARALLYPITLYFLLRRGPERRASRAYLARVLQRPATLRDVARHIHTFAATILDRVFLLSGQLHRFAIGTEGVDALHAHLDAGRGVLLFGSHLGSFEVLRVLARTRPEVVLRVVLDKGHNPAMTQLLDALNPDIAATVIDAAQDGPAIVLAIQQAIADGQMVALLVDRAGPGEAALEAPFLGRDAPFPRAPWLVAANVWMWRETSSSVAGRCSTRVR